MANKKKVTEAAVEKAAEIKEEVKSVAEVAAEKAAPVVKETKAAAAKAKTAGRKAATKTKAAAEKAIAKDSFVLELTGKEPIDLNAVAEACKADYKSKGHRAPKAVTVYVKPEEGVAYYTVNGSGSEDQKISL